MSEQTKVTRTRLRKGVSVMKDIVCCTVVSGRVTYGLNMYDKELTNLPDRHVISYDIKSRGIKIGTSELVLKYHFCFNL